MRAIDGRNRQIGRVSPELVLVDPALAAAARQLLPEAGAWRPATMSASDAASTSAGHATGRLRATAPPIRTPTSIAAARVVTPASERRPNPRRGLVRTVGAVVAGLVCAGSGFGVGVLADDALQPPSAVDLGRTVAVAAGRRTGERPDRPARRRSETSGLVRRRGEAARSPNRNRRSARRPAPRRTLAISRDGVRIGSFAVEKDGSVSAAVAAFGAPTRRAGGRFYCRLTWQRVGLRITFYSVRGGMPCRRGAFVRAVVTGTAWRTNRALRIGARARSVGRLHRRANRLPAGWWSLATITRRRFDPWRPSPRITARVRAGRVVAFYVT